MKILAFGEVMMRLNPANFKKITQTDQLDMSFTGTGLNILAGLAVNGYQTSLLTALPANNLGRAASASVRKLGVNDQPLVFSGQHLGVYLLEMGYGGRPSEVTYLDRSQSAFNQVVLTDDVINQALVGIEMVHICGIALSTSIISRQNALRVARLAAAKKIPLCFDFNFRASLNTETDRESLRACYHEILSSASIVFGSLRDLTELLLISGEDDQAIVQKFMNDFDIKYFGGTIRHKTVEKSELQGYLYSGGNEVVVSDKVSYQTYDRIGTGDAYVSGILTGLIEQWTLQDTVNFATYNAALAHTTYGDSPVLSKEFVLNYIKNKIDVIR
ncbi:sugar kinase [Vagococcus zengguangii]|uniref:Sugar kinase n=1 Tax=Vagococcus zengguangii TaxID=2571750 RepID=A0A4D7CVM6_9ENTE|nr:sugar kinase [Vagococcus zengguangii]QCI86116.1 sugar kinase [Vagococcus zengguangii]